MKATIFYSWQSDVPYTRHAIYKAMELAATELKRTNPETILEIEQATRNESGAVHIPDTILQKISQADIFICDLSIVCESTNRKFPNPNVLIELGCAISELAWDRIIILFNKNHGKFPGDLPFDIEKRRCFGFKADGENDSNGIGQLRTGLAHEISQI